MHDENLDLKVSSWKKISTIRCPCLSLLICPWIYITSFSSKKLFSIICSVIFVFDFACDVLTTWGPGWPVQLDESMFNHKRRGGVGRQARQTPDFDQPGTIWRWLRAVRSSIHGQPQPKLCWHYYWEWSQGGIGSNRNQRWLNLWIAELHAVQFSEINQYSRKECVSCGNMGNQSTKQMTQSKHLAHDGGVHKELDFVNQLLRIF